MFKKIFEYAGPYKKNMYVATVVVLVSVLMGVLPFVLAYQVIASLVMGESIEASFIILRVVLVLACLVLQALFYGWGLNLSHKAAYDTLLRLRTALQKRFEKLPLGVIQDKGTGTVKKLFVDDVDSLEVLLAHSMPEGIANLMIPIAVYVAMFFVDWKLALLSLASMKKWWRPQRKLSVWSSLRNFRRVFIRWLVMQEKCSPAVSASVFLWQGQS